VIFPVVRDQIFQPEMFYFGFLAKWMLTSSDLDPSITLAIDAPTAGKRRTRARSLTWAASILGCKRAGGAAPYREKCPLCLYR
jgi:hypothetical protein